MIIPLSKRQMLLADDLHRCRLALLTEAHRLGLAIGERRCDFHQVARQSSVVVNGHRMVCGELQTAVDEARTQEAAHG